MSEPSDMPATPGEAPPRRRRRLSILTVMLGVVLGSALTLVAILAVLVWLYRDAAPNLTQETLDEAVKRWESQGLVDYNLQVKLTGRQEADIRVEVRDGKTTAMTYNGRLQPRPTVKGQLETTTWEAWTVKGQLEMIQRELTNRNEQTQKTFGVSSPLKVVLRAEFDPQLGYLRKYSRVVLNPDQGGSDHDISWQIIEFEEVSNPM